MQCVSCKFENIPGVQSCGRCGSALGLATAVIDVHPPRAQPWAKSLRRWLPLQSGYYQARDAFSEFRRASTAAADSLRVPIPERRLLLRLVVPGWAHLVCNQRFRGYLFLSSYLVLLVPGLIFLGTTLGSILLGLAFSVHASSALDLMLQCGGPFPSRVGTALVVMMSLALGVYLPAGWLLTRVANPRVLTAAVPPFEEDDVVLENQWAFAFSRPRPGQVVVFQGPGTRMPANPERHNAVVVPPGERIDRILAGPGSQVRWDKGQLTVNGEVVPWQPLNPSRLPPQIRFSVPPDHYLILPTTVPYLTAQISSAEWERLGYIAARDIMGTAYVRYQPLSRFWVIR
jgi:hypothetical protein